MKFDASIIASMIAGAGALLLFAAQDAGKDSPPPLGFSASGLDDKVKALSYAISRAEGFGVPGAIPTKANNPGDLVLGDVGFGVLGSGKITVFDSLDRGWQELYKRTYHWLTGASKIYSISDSLYEIGRKYVNGPNAMASADSNEWAVNVALILGIDPDTALENWIGA